MKTNCDSFVSKKIDVQTQQNAKSREIYLSPLLKDMDF